MKIRDRGAAIDGERIRFSSAILPKWARRTKSLDALLPVLYLRGISTGDFQEALAALLGKEAPNLSAAVISRLTSEWKDEYDRWQKRDLSARRYVYVWADGVYLQARMEDNAECMLVLLGATPEGKKELVGFQVGIRESAQSWRELLVEVKQRGLKIAPEIAVGDGGLGFWKAIDEVFPGTRHQRCWVHKTANVLNKVPLSVQANMKKDLREVYLAPNCALAEVAIDVFAEKYGAKYDKAVDCLTKDRETMLAFYDFPAEHWDHLRTTNPIESVFATVRHRTVRTKGSLSSTTAKLMVFKLVIAASKTWRRLQGQNQLPKVIGGGAVFGLTCAKHQSGEVDWSGRISRCGDEMMRAMLYEAAQSMLLHSKKWSWLKVWAMQIARRRGMKKAIVALARRLAVILHRIWVDGTEFRWTREQAAAAA